MTKIAIVADVHITNHKRLGGEPELGLNDRCRLSIAALRRACWEAYDRGARRLYIAGDLFDHTSPGPRILAAVQDVLAESRARGCPVVVMPGNHDQISAEPGNHALGPLRYVATVIDRPYVDRLGDVEVIVIPHRPGPAGTWLRPAIAEADSESPTDEGHSPSGRVFRVLVLHLGISSKSTPEYLLRDQSAIPLTGLAEIADEYEIDLVASGHWHNLASFELGGARAVQVGALAPAGWSDEGVEDRGRMLLVEGSHVETVEIPGPRFVRIEGYDGAEELEALAAQAKGSSLFVEWLAPPESSDDARDDLRVLLERGTVYRGSVLVSVDEVNDAAREAAAAARASDSLSDALLTYVGKINLPEGLDRTRIYELCRRFTGID